MNIRRADIPEARKAAVDDFSPAEAKRRGAYYSENIIINFKMIRGKDSHKAPHQFHSPAASPLETLPVLSSSNYRVQIQQTDPRP
jgi:hypothetical protein